MIAHIMAEGKLHGTGSAATILSAYSEDENFWDTTENDEITSLVGADKLV